MTEDAMDANGAEGMYVRKGIEEVILFCINIIILPKKVYLGWLCFRVCQNVVVAFLGGVFPF